MGSGDVSYCSGAECRRVSTFHRMPNGLVQGHDGLIYVPSSMTGAIQVYRARQGGELSKVANITIPYAIDNLSVDANGDIWAAVFPRGIEILQASKDPLNARVKSAVIRIRRRVCDEPYEWEKVVEDGEAEVLPGSTTVVHDAKTGRLFFSGESGQCEPHEATLTYLGRGEFAIYRCLRTQKVKRSWQTGLIHDFPVFQGQFLKQW